MPMPAVKIANTSIHTRTPSKLLQIKRNNPLDGVMGFASG